jgi:hypothetical protein
MLDDQAEAPQADDGDRRGVLGPVLILIVLLLLLLVRAVGLRAAAPDPVVAEPAPEEARPPGVHCWLGSARMSGGTAVVRARLGRLNADPAQQTFDARALGGQLGLGPGEPWRLDLGLVRAADSPDGTPVPTGASDTLAIVVGLGLAGLEVLDDDGRPGPRLARRCRHSRSRRRRRAPTRAISRLRWRRPAV